MRLFSLFIFFGRGRLFEGALVNISAFKGRLLFEGEHINISGFRGWDAYLRGAFNRGISVDKSYLEMLINHRKHERFTLVYKKEEISRSKKKSGKDGRVFVLFLSEKLV